MKCRPLRRGSNIDTAPRGRQKQNEARCAVRKVAAERVAPGRREVGAEQQLATQATSKIENRSLYL
jgi:hypothetical protein